MQKTKELKTNTQRTGAGNGKRKEQEEVSRNEVRESIRPFG
jgi:hypothetical protein